MKNNIIKLSTIVMLFTTLVIGCSKLDLVEDPPHILTADNLYTSFEGFQSGVNALYANARMERYNLASPSSLTIQFALGGTDIITGTYWTLDQNEFGDRITPEHAQIRNLWDWLYSIINASNTIINRAEITKIDWKDAERDQFIGEAKFFRAWAYRHLTYLYGDVPLTLEESSGDNIKTDWVRTPVSEVRSQIIEDLKFSSEHLSGEPNSEASNVTSWVAKHFLAEMYLTIGENNLAEQMALDVINNSPFSLVTSRYGVNLGVPGSPFTDMFINGNRNRSEGNTEAMWNYQYEYNVIGGGASYNRRIFLMRYHKLGLEVTVDRGGRGQGYLGATSHLFDLYRGEGSDDDRFGEYAWRKYYIISGDDNLKSEYSSLLVGDTLFLQNTEANHFFKNILWSSTRKFEDALEDNVATSNGYNDYTALRLANTYLILAEAQMKNGNSGGAAITINILRDRANTSNVTAGDIDIDFILDERGRELFGEAHRKYHLLRNGLWLSRTNTYNKLVEGRATERDKLLPIPQQVIDANITGDFPQNPGY